MKSNTFIILCVVILLACGAWYFSAQRPVIQNEPSVVETESRYVPFSQIAFDTAKNMKRVLFFHAPWCPTCRPADQSFQQNAGAIPQDVVLFKTDYDSSTELKKQYNVTYQHTYVLVDSDGKEIIKWNGGGIDELISNTQ